LARPLIGAISALLLGSVVIGSASSTSVARVLGSQGLTPYRVPSAAMEPTLHCARPGANCRAAIADVALARPLKKSEPRRFDIVLFHAPAAARLACGAGGIYIKRVIGLPGETIIDRQGFIFVNGRKLSEPYVAKWARDQSYAGRVWAVPAGMYLLLGDYRAQSCDSREFGAVPRRSLLRKVVAVRRGSVTIRLTAGLMLAGR
jgi:signal peptidase I